MRLGFPVKIVGRPGLRSHDSRRWRNNPHLSVSLAYLRDIFLYLDSQNIRMYRMSSDLAPYLTHPTFTQFHKQIEECESELAAVGQMARDFDLRLSFHAPAHVLLNTPNPDRLAQSIAELNALARMLDLMGLGEEAVIVVHVGGHYDDRERALAGFAQTFGQLPKRTQQRLVLENDDRRFGVADCLWLHQETGIRLVFDYSPPSVAQSHRYSRPPRSGRLPGHLAPAADAENPHLHPCHRDGARPAALAPPTSLQPPQPLCQPFPHYRFPARPPPHEIIRYDAGSEGLRPGAAAIPSASRHLRQ